MDFFYRYLKSLAFLKCYDPLLFDSTVPGLTVHAIFLVYSIPFYCICTILEEWRETGRNPSGVSHEGKVGKKNSEEGKMYKNLKLG